MTAVVKSPPTRPIINRLVEAIGWAMARGIPIRLSEHGVRCVSSLVDVRWERDPASHGVNPIGAAVLMHQPAKTAMPDAGADALGVSIPYVEGLADGLAQCELSNAWRTSLARHRYLAGVGQGATLRIAILSRNCKRDPAHGPYPLDKRTCPKCEAPALVVVTGGRS